jgi:DNA-binding transcriptional LysR family regulator
MEIQQILSFCHLAKERSFSKAAISTFRTQSAISQQVKALEGELGCLLIERVGRRRLQLTPAGQYFLEFAKSFLAQHSILMENIDEIKGGKSGLLKIAAQTGPLLSIFPDLIKEYEKLYPKVEMRIYERAPSDIITEIKSGDLDFGIASEELIPKDLAFIRWRKTDPHVVTPIGHPLTKSSEITLSDLAKYPLILSPKILKYSLRVKLEKKFMKEGLNYRIAMEASNFMLAATYVELGIGITFAAMGYELDKILPKKKVSFISVRHLFESNYFAVVMRKERELRPYKERFLNLLLNKSIEK